LRMQNSLPVHEYIHVQFEKSALYARKNMALFQQEACNV